LDVQTTIEGYIKLWVMKLGIETNLIQQIKIHNKNQPLIQKPKWKSDPIFIIKSQKSK
jgi:hypothetical protein